MAQQVLILEKNDIVTTFFGTSVEIITDVCNIVIKYDAIDHLISDLRKLKREIDKQESKIIEDISTNYGGC